MEMDEKKIMDFIVSEYSWEQVIYEVIAWEGMNPWDLDLTILADSFVKYLETLEDLDFRIPAKYIIVAAVLLKMKSDYLRAFKEQVTGQEEQELQEELQETEEEEKFEISPVNVPPRRKPVRRIVITELITALKKVIKADERKETRKKRLRKDVDIKGDDLNTRIRNLYEKINSILLRIKKREIEFSELIDKWEKVEIVNTFVPLIYLDEQKKVNCKQKKVFDKIWVSRREGK